MSPLQGCSKNCGYTHRGYQSACRGPGLTKVQYHFSFTGWPSKYEACVETNLITYSFFSRALQQKFSTLLLHLSHKLFLNRCKTYIPSEETLNKVWWSHLMFSLQIFKGCLPQILLGPILNTLTHIIRYILILCIFWYIQSYLRVRDFRSHFNSSVFLYYNADLLYRNCSRALERTEMTGNTDAKWVNRLMYHAPKWSDTLLKILQGTLQDF